MRYARTRFLLLPNDSKPCRNPVGSKRSLGHVPTKLNIKGPPHFLRPLLFLFLIFFILCFLFNHLTSIFLYRKKQFFLFQSIAVCIGQCCFRYGKLDNGEAEAALLCECSIKNNACFFLADFDGNTGGF